MNATVDGTLSIRAHMVQSIKYISQIDGVSGVDAVPAFTISFVAEPIVDTSGVLPINLTKHSFLDSVIGGESSTILSGEFRPLKLMTTTIDANGEVSSFFVRDAVFNGEIISVSDITPDLSLIRSYVAGLTGTSQIKGWISVPDKLRRLIVESSGIVISGDSEGQVVFNTQTQQYEITVRGITIVQLNDLVNATNQTIVVLE